MSARERMLAMILMGLIFLAVGGFVGYLIFIGPIQSRSSRANQLQAEIDKLDEDIDTLRKDAKRITAVKARSLPADPVLAREEYKEALAVLLRDAGAPPGFTIVPRSGDTRSVPTIAPKKPAYTRLVFDMNLDKVDLPTITEFLENYHRLDLAHRITGFTIKRNEDARNNSGRNDLKVTLTTEAIQMDGAEKRRTLLSVPPVLAAVAGGAGYQAVAHTPEAGRGLIGSGLATVLASDREYAVLAARDFFHGPLPPLPPPLPPPTVAEPPPPPKPREDVAPYVRLVGLTVRSDGSAIADVWDTINNEKYEVETGGDGTVVRKYAPSSSGSQELDRDYRSRGLVRIAPPDSSTDRSFRLVAVTGDGIYLADARSQAPPPGDALAAVFGGPAMLAEVPALYYWKVGRSLKDLTPLPADETRTILDSITAALEQDRTNLRNAEAGS